ncbi:hypothetical protein Anapl_15024 [Anas platyrhynchos]|uniref:Uncharacterized protein n=1 Tax=Anas platyrhynchos TaxID=8839 RepID=R0L1R2_ANAPL|nr:hypothetical protein Anapl_15024 [Anas platyrhynchos]
MADLRKCSHLWISVSSSSVKQWRMQGALEQCSGQGEPFMGSLSPFLAPPPSSGHGSRPSTASVGIRRVACRQHLALHVVEEQPRATWKEGYLAFKGKD